MRLSKQTLFALAATVAAAAATAIAVAVPASGTTAADEPPPLVEDYSYPGAAELLATDHVQLISGDGHLLYKPCPAAEAPGLIIVRSTDRIGSAGNGRLCFAVVGDTGHLSLKIPNVYAVRGDGTSTAPGHKLKAQLTTDAGAHTTVDVNPNSDTQVGIGTSPPGDATALLQLDASR
ncbi:hypothetical protein [Amycolatopsis sp. NPDC054798]